MTAKGVATDVSGSRSRPMKSAGSDLIGMLNGANVFHITRTISSSFRATLNHVTIRTVILSKEQAKNSPPKTQLVLCLPRGKLKFPGEWESWEIHGKQKN